MKNNTSLAIFETHKIRRHFDEKTETWYFSVIDIVAALTEQHDYQKARNYWNKLAQRLREEGNESVTKCQRLKLEASDGKRYLTDVADVKTILRLIQSVPSKKAEPIKLWLVNKAHKNFKVNIDVFFKDDTLWLTQKKMGELFEVNVPAISKHLDNIYGDGELNKEATVSILETVQDKFFESDFDLEAKKY